MSDEFRVRIVRYTTAAYAECVEGDAWASYKVNPHEPVTSLRMSAHDARRQAEKLIAKAELMERMADTLEAEKGSGQ